jgi:hypothetical protein
VGSLPLVDVDKATFLIGAARLVMTLRSKVAFGSESAGRQQAGRRDRRLQRRVACRLFRHVGDVARIRKNCEARRQRMSAPTGK